MSMAIVKKIYDNCLQTKFQQIKVKFSISNKKKIGFIVWYFFHLNL